MTKSLHIATSRPIGQRCIQHATEMGYTLVSMEEADVFISVMYDTLIPEEYIRAHKCFNIHPGVLPWYRGAGAYSWAIMNGEFEAGVTLHEIDKDIDHGDVLGMHRFPITKEDTAGSLFAKAETAIYNIFCEWLYRMVNGEYDAHIQESGRIYYRKDLEKARDITRIIRAFTFEGKPNAFYINSKGKKIDITY